MNTKVFLVDLDGVVLHRTAYFSERAKELYPSANHAAILEFFTKGLYKEVTLGKRDLVEALSEVLPAWNVSRNANQVLTDWFEGENNIDYAALERIQGIRNSGVRCVLATDHSQFRKNQVWEDLGMKDFFDNIIASADVGATKHDSEFYLQSLKRLDIEKPQDVVFTDDDPKNVEVAKEVGLNAFVFEDIASLEQI
jgi:HAD superfamily hydrolase (TIGR01509 family)